MNWLVAFFSVVLYSCVRTCLRAARRGHDDDAARWGSLAVLALLGLAKEMLR